MSQGASDRRTRILYTAEGLARTRGYNGFSYADAAAEVGVTKASIHFGCALPLSREKRKPRTERAN